MLLYLQITFNYFCMGERGIGTHKGAREQASWDAWKAPRTGGEEEAAAKKNLSQETEAVFKLNLGDDKPLDLDTGPDYKKRLDARTSMDLHAVREEQTASGLEVDERKDFRERGKVLPPREPKTRFPGEVQKGPEKSARSVA